MENDTEVSLEKRPLLYEFISKARSRFNSIKSLPDEDYKKYQELREIISEIEIIPEINFEFLKILKKNKISYIQNGENYDYNSNFNMLKETLTSEQYKFLEKKDPINPLERLIKLLKKISVAKEEEYQEILKDKLDYTLNFPLIDGIERLRLWYYMNYILNENTFNNIKSMKDYIDVIQLDKDITSLDIDKTNFGIKIYFVILYLSDLMTIHISFYSRMYFLKNIIKDNFTLGNIIKAGSITIWTDDEIYFHINNIFEDKEIVINKEDYIMTSLITDLTKDSSYPTKLILFRNESFLRFEKYGGFIKELGLFDSFISYIKAFIKSKCMQEILSINEYKYIRELVNNENYLNRILSEKHLKFLPFFGVNNIFGYTDKNMLISTINSIPGIVRLAQYKKRKTYKILYHISILLSICE